jgi:putative transposase
VIVTYETMRQWCRKFGQVYANVLRRCRPRLGDTCHLDEVFVQINGVQHYLWRAVDQDGNVLDILVQPRRDKRAAKKFFRRLLKRLAYVSRVLITDKLASYSVARREVLPSVEHHRHKGLNNRAATTSPPPRTARPATNASPSGGRSPAPRRWPEWHRPLDFGCPRTALSIRRTRKLTVSQKVNAWKTFWYFSI